jgi:ATP adenylyltransferase
MDRLWAPWRINYIKTARKQKGCIFCSAAKSKGRHYVIFKTRYSLCMLNTFPYNNGHLMLSPIRHVKSTVQLKRNEIIDLFGALNDAQELLNKVLKPQGYNIGINLSEIAGAGITGHLHIHIVPRWRGDVNFMPTLSDTKVIPQSLNELHKQLTRNVKSTANQRIRR